MASLKHRFAKRPSASHHRPRRRTAKGLENGLAQRTALPGPDTTIYLRVLRRSFLPQAATDTKGCHSELDSESPWPHLPLSRGFRIGVRNDKQLKFLIGTTEAGCQVRKSFPAVSGRGTPRPYVNPFAAPTRTISTRTVQRSNVKRLTLNP
jgi:hypothetical protein